MPKEIILQISQNLIESSSINEKTYLVDRMYSLLGIKINPSLEGDAKNKNLEATEWLVFVSKYRLTPGEIYYAHELALLGKISDKGGKKFDLYALLSINSTSNVLYAYENHKRQSQEVEKGREKLKELITPKVKLTKKQIKQEEMEYLKTERQRLLDDGIIIGANWFYDTIQKKGINMISLNMVMKILAKYKPVEHVRKSSNRGSATISGIVATMVEKRDVTVYFQDIFVYSFIKANKIDELSENEWIKYWMSE